jgi:hypothetical protein
LVALSFAGLLLARTEISRRVNAPIDRYGRTSEIADDLRKAMTLADPRGVARVVVLGDSSTQGALVAMERQGWTFPGYPELRSPPSDPSTLPGATHILMIGYGAAPLGSSIPIASGIGWQLRTIVRP